MKLVMTLLVRDEADIVDAQIAFHLNAGVDFVIATDNRSEDGTTEILESYARDRYLHLIREPSEELRQAEWVTRMARLAATDFGADWVLNTDADEFWWPQGGTLKAILSEIPSRFDTVRAHLRNFVPRSDVNGSFAERMIVREVPRGGELTTPLRLQDKVVHRANPTVTLTMGNHDASWEGLVDLRGWYPIEVLHFPMRSPGQCARKIGYWYAYWEPLGLQREHHRGFEALREGSIGDYYASLAVDDEALANRLADGSLVSDTRLRDVLRSLRDTHDADTSRGREFLAPAQGAPPLTFSRQTSEEQAAYAAEITVGSVRDSVSKTEQRLDEAGRRLAELERGVGSRLWARAARSARVRFATRGDGRR